MDITQGITFIRSNDKTLKLSFLLQIDRSLNKIIQNKWHTEINEKNKFP